MIPTQFDAAIELQLDILRTDVSIRKDVLALLKQLEIDLISEVSTATYTVWGRARVNRQVTEVRGLISSYYARIADVALEGTGAIADVSAAVTGAALTVSTTAVVPSAIVLNTLVRDSLVQGAAQGAWWSKQSADTSFRFGQAVRQGVVRGENNQQIINRVKGFLDTTQANAASLVQTSVATIANDSRQAVFDANQDIIKRYRGVATLDVSTCPICAPLDGLEWTKAQNPIGHKFPFPNYPKHFNCRCLLIGVVFDGPQGGARASDSGPVDASLNFDGWLKRQPLDKQTEILGKGRAEMYQSGKITLSDLVTGQGKPLTIVELKSKYTN